MKRTITALCLTGVCVLSPTLRAEPAQTANSKKAAAKPAAKTDPNTVTLTGCLRADGNPYKFVLTDIDGSKAPKSRSWRSGYLKKKAAKVEIVGASSTVKLHDHVGHKVAVTGVKDPGSETHLKARSIRHIAAACS
jgi:hypothetical protein